jgi:hypothetical protein
MSGRRYDPHREQFWREALAAWEKSEQSVRAYCASHRLQETNFYRWRRTLRERDRRRRPAKQLPTFMPLRVVPEPVLEVVLPIGPVVRVPPGTDSTSVATLVAALRRATC